MPKKRLPQKFVERRTRSEERKAAEARERRNENLRALTREVSSVLEPSPSVVAEGVENSIPDADANRAAIQRLETLHGEKDIECQKLVRELSETTHRLERILSERDTVEEQELQAIEDNQPGEALKFGTELGVLTTRLRDCRAERRRLEIELEEVRTQLQESRNERFRLENEVRRRDFRSEETPSAQIVVTSRAGIPDSKAKGNMKIRTNGTGKMVEISRPKAGTLWL